MKAKPAPTEDTPGDVVVVDDTPANLQLLVSILDAHGYRVRPVTNGSAALRTIRTRTPDLVLLDIDMPGMNGIETCRRIKSLERTRDTPVIFISVITDGAEKVNAFACGGVDYITKPFEVDEVLARVGTHIALSRSRRQLAANLGQLRALEATRDALTHMIVHDMRSPLLTIGVAVDLLAPLVPAADVERARAARNAQDCVASLLEMITRMLEVSRMEQQGLPLERTEVDVAELAAEVVERFRVRAAGRALLLAAAGPASVCVDRGVIVRVLENLIGNALKFTAPSGRVEVRVGAGAGPGRAIRVDVIDDGPGIAPADRARLFTRFGRVSPGDGERGFGLGLAFVRLAVEAHGGTVGVRSESGRGSEFWLELPIEPTPSPDGGD